MKEFIEVKDELLLITTNIIKSNHLDSMISNYTKNIDMKGIYLFRLKFNGKNLKLKKSYNLYYQSENKCIEAIEKFVYNNFDKYYDVLFSAELIDKDFNTSKYDKKRATKQIAKILISEKLIEIRKYNLTIDMEYELNKGYKNKI